MHPIMNNGLSSCAPMSEMNLFEVVSWALATVVGRKVLTGCSGQAS